MNKKEAQKKYNKKIRLIDEYNKHYYIKSLPLVTDKEYDEIKNEIYILEKKYKYLNSEKSPSKSVGYKPSKNFKKALHRAPMLSLANAFSKEDLINFEKRILNFLSKNNDFKLSYSAEPKIDGISASLIYKNRKFSSSEIKFKILFSKLIKSSLSNALDRESIGTLCKAFLKFFEGLYPILLFGESL